jgi:hypothetical protein
MVHQNHEEEKNSSEFFEADPVEESDDSSPPPGLPTCRRSKNPLGFFSSRIFPAGTSGSPTGGGGAYDASELPVQKFFALLCAGNTELSQLGRLSGGAEPLERLCARNEFARVKKKWSE